MQVEMTEGKPTSVDRQLLMTRCLTVLAFVGTLALGLVVPFPVNGRIWSEVFNLAHAPAFFFSVAFASAIIHPEAAGLPGDYKPLLRMTWTRLISIAALAMTLGLLGELAQSFVGRSASIHDVLANTFGIAAGCLWIVGYLVSAGKLLFRCVSVIVVVAASFNPIMEINEAQEQRAEFPLLASFERARELNAWELQGVSVQQTSDWATDGKKSLRVIPRSNEFPGIVMQWVPEDWSDQTSLHLDLHNASTNQQELVLKIADKLHADSGFPDGDRFEREIIIPGGDTVHIESSLEAVKTAPENREMDLRQIELLQIFSLNGVEAGSFEIDNIRLE